MLDGIDWASVLTFAGVGFAAQIVDGALGMAFGVLSSTLLVSVLGVPPATASASVHLVECFTTGVSGVSHAMLRNIDWRLFWRLLLPGVAGGVAGAYLLSSIDAGVTRPFVMTYLAAIGVYLLWRGLRYPPQAGEPRFIAPLGLAGGFLDAAGGGGWGPVVTSNLLVQGAAPRTTIGTVNAVEFFLTTSVSITFIAALGFEAFTTAVAGLLLGGVVAAPFGAVLASRIPAKLLLVMVGAVLTLTSLYSLFRALS